MFDMFVLGVTKMYINICVFLVSIPYFYLLSTGIPSTCTYTVDILFIYHILGTVYETYDFKKA